MAGYVRQRASQIVNDSLADATDVAAEFNQVQTAFNATAGHTHDGSSGEGAPITVVGPAQDFVASASALAPKVTATYSLGTTGLRYTTGWFSGAVTAAGFTGPLTGAVTGDVTGNVIGNLTGNVTGNITGAVTGNASTATTLATARNINGTSFNGSANITTSLWGTGRTITIGSTGKSVNGSANVSWTLGEIGVNNSTLTLSTSGIATGSQTWTSNQGSNATFTVNVPPTNLSASSNTTSVTINSSTGSATGIPQATTTNAGMLSAADKTKLEGIATGAQVNSVTSVAGRTGAVTLSASDVSGFATVATTGAYSDLSGTPTLPANLTQAEAENSASTVFGLVSGQRLAQAYDARTSAQRYTSAQQTMAGNTLLTLAHGLGANPFDYRLQMICVTAEHGYSVGDTVFTIGGESWLGDAATSGFNVYSDATNIYVVPAPNIVLSPKGTAGTLAYATLSSWRLIVRAWI